jgi:hypothetical protein
MKKPAKVIPLGKPLDTPDEDLDMLALVSVEDIEAAKADARARMGKRGAAMLEAERAEVTEDASMGRE